MLIKMGFVGAVLAFSLSACGDKGPSMSGKDSAAAQEAIRSLSATVVETAGSLAVLNPKHDKQYFVDRQTQSIKECINASDFESCYKPKLDAMRYE